jgi:hypothetical protein
MSDNEFDELVGDMKRNHNAPPTVPRERMWARIEERRRLARTAPTPADRAHARPPAAGWRRWRVGLAMAAVLLLGIALGRMTLRPDAGPELAAGSDEPVVDEPAAARPERERSALVSYAAASLFHRADVLLTGLQTEPCGQDDLSPLPAWAGGMLVQTRLLMDSELGTDPDLKALLQDLELILARIADLSREDCAADMDRIRKDIRDKATLDRLRLAAAGA